MGAVRRLGLFGGTFDPPHVGHLLAASDACEGLALDRLIFVPAATQPLKAGREAAPAADRLAMVRLLAGDDSRFDVDPVEIEREGLSYTVDTLEAAVTKYRDADLFFLAGADVFATFSKWRDPRRVMELAQVVMLVRVEGARTRFVPFSLPVEAGIHRRGGDGEADELENRSELVAAAEVERILAADGNGGVARAPLMLPTRRIDLSSTEIRRRVREGRTIHGFVPDAIADYVARAGLYR